MKTKMIKTNIFSYKKEDIKDLLPERSEASHKGTFGRVLIIGGAPCMAGAPCFSARAAYRTGAGLVEIFTHEKNRVIAQTLIPEAILSVWESLPDDLEALLQSIKKADVIAIGMGLSQSKEAAQILRFTLQNRSCPIIIDADGINLLAAEKELLPLIGDNAIITPHPLEASRLSGLSVKDITSDIPSSSKKISDLFGVVCLLKDHRTAISSPANDKIYINQSGNSGMSTGGSGDVLDGIIAGLIAQGKSPLGSACLAAYIHGLAGELASDALSEYSVMARDIIEAIPAVIKNAK